jgi:multiple sugar transport system permease protein
LKEPRLASRRHSTDLKWAMVFLAPNFLGFLIFVAVPVAFSLVMAFTNWDLVQRAPLRFVGFENFRRMLWGPESQTFWKFFMTTVYLMLGIPVSIAGSLLLAVLLSEPLHMGCRKTFAILVTIGSVSLLIGCWLCRYESWEAMGLALAIISGSSLVALVFNRVGLRTLFYLPFFTTGVAQFILWKLLFRPDIGPINEVIRAVLAAFHIDSVVPPNWLGSMDNLLSLDPETGMFAQGNFGLGARDAIVIMGIWATVGGNNMLLYLAGLSNVPGELYEAAMIDGAGRWRTFWNVSWPQLAPTTFFIVIMSVIAGLQGGFEQARIMTEGRPADTTVTLGFYIYREGFEEFRLGFASAVAWMMFVMIFAATLVNWRFGSRQINA